MDDERLIEWDAVPPPAPEDAELEPKLSAREELGFAPTQLTVKLEQAAVRAEATKEYCSYHPEQVVRPCYVRCPRCEGERNRKHVDALWAVIRELRDGRPNPERERLLVKQLYALNHPQPKEFLEHLRTRHEGGRRGSL